MKSSLILAAVSSLTLSGIAAADTGDQAGSPDKDVPETSVSDAGNPAPAIDMPVVDKPELGIETATATGDKPEAGETAAQPERGDHPGKPASR